MGGRGIFLESLRDVNMRVKEDSRGINVVDLARDKARGRNGTGSNLGLGTPDERREIRQGFIKKAQPLDRLTSTGRMFSDSLGLR